VTAPVRVLVVDDEPYITDVVASALAFEGFATEEASTVARALATPVPGDSTASCST
jgi:DNA-binding response OmpR family regulator